MPVRIPRMQMRTLRLRNLNPSGLLKDQNRPSQVPNETKAINKQTRLWSATNTNIQSVSGPAVHKQIQFQQRSIINLEKA